MCGCAVRATASIAWDTSTPPTWRPRSAMKAATRPGPHPTSATRPTVRLLINSMKATSSDRSMGPSVAELISEPTNWTYLGAATSKTARAVATWSSLDTLQGYVTSDLRFRRLGRAGLHPHAGYVKHSSGD